MTARERRTTAFDILRGGAGLVVIGLLAALYPRISDFGSASIYAATWVTVLHLCIGEYVLVRHLQARSRIQCALDLMAIVFVAGLSVSFTSTPVWCVFLGAVCAIAVVKYLLVADTTHRSAFRQYAHAKIRWEAPGVVLFPVIAIVLAELPADSPVVLVVEAGLFAIAAGFAFWMIGIRRVYCRMGRFQDDPNGPV